MAKWTQIRVKCQTVDLDTVSAVMSMVDNGLMIEDATDVDNVKTCYGDLIDEKVKNADRTVGAVSIYIPEDRSVEEGVAFIDAHLSENGVKHEISLIPMAEEDWADSWKQYYHPVRIGGRLVVVPTWEKSEYKAKDGDLVLYMDPGMAFGTGTHETTRLCAILLEENMKKGDDVLDIGTGSGILSISASKLGANSVLATDIDPMAVRVAKENCEMNGCQNIGVIVSDLLKAVTGQYDFICANIVADILVRLAPNVKRVLKKGGLIAVSGVINTQRDRVISVLTENGLTLVDERTENDWVSLLMTNA